MQQNDTKNLTFLTPYTWQLDLMIFAIPYSVFLYQSVAYTTM